MIGGEKKKKGKLSGGAIAGIVVGSVVILLLVVFALILLCRSGDKTRSVDNVNNIVGLKEEQQLHGKITRKRSSEGVLDLRKTFLIFDFEIGVVL